MSNENIFAVHKVTGVICSAEHAFRGSGIYRCCDEECGGDVFVRRGEVRTAHFCHCHHHDSESCSRNNGGETQAHYDSKHFVARNLEAFRFVVNRCQTCGERNVKRFCNGHVALVEGLVKDTKRRADVLVKDKEGKADIAAIEILHTHRVGQDKRRELERVGTAVVEIEASDVQKFIHATSGSDGGVFYINTTQVGREECDNCAMFHDYEYHTNKLCVSEMIYNLGWDKYCCKRQKLYKTRLAGLQEYTHVRLNHLDHERDLLSAYEPDTIGNIQSQKLWQEYECNQHRNRKRKCLQLFPEGLKFSSTRTWMETCKKFCDERDNGRIHRATSSWLSLSRMPPDGIHSLGEGNVMYDTCMACGEKM